MSTTYYHLTVILAVASVLIPAGRSLGAAADVGLLPGQKKALVVETKERNPFAIVVKSEETPEVTEDTTLQEQRIRKFFADATVGGVMRGSSGYKVLIGSMILEAGALVPPVIPGQTEVLEVRSIDEKTIEFAWVETEDLPPNAPVRQMTIDLNVGPAVRTQLPGTTGAKGADNVEYRRMGDQQEELRQAMVTEVER